MKFKIAVLPGDGIGPEVVAQGVKVLRAIARRFGHDLDLDFRPIGAQAMDEFELPLPPETLEACRKADSVLLGAVGDPRFDNVPDGARRPEQAFSIRDELGLTACLRFAKAYPALVNATRFKPEAIAGVDIITVRDFIRWTATARESSEQVARRLLTIAFEMARGRRKMLTSVGSGGLAHSKLWREIAVEVGKEYPDVELRLLAPDTACMQLVTNPSSLDVVVSDHPTVGGMMDNLAATLGGGIGMSPSAELRATDGNIYGIFGLHQPIHGSAPKYTGMDRVNPIGTIRAVRTLLLYSLNRPDEARAVEDAVVGVLESYRTRDTMEAGKTEVGTQRMGDLIAEAVLAAG